MVPVCYHYADAKRQRVTAARTFDSPFSSSGRRLLHRGGALSAHADSAIQAIAPRAFMGPLLFMTREEKMRFYHSQAWRRMSERILIRDHYECQECRKKLKSGVRTKIKRAITSRRSVTAAITKHMEGHGRRISVRERNMQQRSVGRYPPPKSLRFSSGEERKGRPRLRKNLINITRKG